MGHNITQKIIKEHLVSGEMKAGTEISIRIDQTLTQDSTGTMAYLQFEAMGIPKVKTKKSVAYIDHNMLQTGFENADDHKYIQTVTKKHGIYFSKPGNGICHQVQLERFGVPGWTLLGSDSHTPTGGGLGMLAIGAGGLDVAASMGGGAYFLTMPKVVRVILKGKLSGQMKPDKVIPFKYGKEEAERKFLEFTKKRWFLPKGFAEKKRAEKISGIYYPFWVTDADTDASLSADATKVRTWRVGNKRYTETSKYRVERAGFIHFEDIVTSAISEEDKAMLEGILPYPSESLTPFDMSYLSGFSAKKRNIERESLSKEVKDRMDGYASTLLRDTIGGYATVSVRQNRLSIRQSHWEYSLMPIWILNYRTKKKMYTYAMNGYTGKIYGELPICIKKLSFAAAGLFTVLAGIAALIGGIIL